MLSTMASWFMALFGVPVIVIGLFLIFCQLPIDAWLRRRLYYALFDERGTAAGRSIARYQSGV